MDNDESDPLLLHQWNDVSSNDEMLERTSMFKGCYHFITRLNDLVEEDIFSASAPRRRELLKSAMFEYWTT